MSLGRDVSLKDLNTLRLPARAEWLAEPASPNELTELLADARFGGMPRIVIGGGSNLVLVGDIPGLTIHPCMRGVRELDRDGDSVRVEVMAGENWDAVVCHTLAQGWQGLENLSLIPGSAGAAPFQNIGAYGVELSDVLESLQAVELATGKARRFSAAECDFAYRDSIFKSRCPGEFLIVSLVLRLNLTPCLRLDYGPLRKLADSVAANELTPQRVRETVCAVRRAKLPDPADLPNAGSFFKNPVVSAGEQARLSERFPDLVSFPAAGGDYKLAAGWLIEKAGWKGRRHGALGMHAEQALVMVNYGESTGAEVLAFAGEVRASVESMFGVTLEQEPVILPRERDGGRGQGTGSR